MANTTNQRNKTFTLNVGPVKPFLTIEEQVKLLKERGLEIRDEENAKDILRRTNYYRLSGYSLTLQTDDKYHEGVTFDRIYEIYKFDDAFRKLLLCYSLNVEVAFRSYIAHEHARVHGPLGYLDAANFVSAKFHQHFIENITEEVERSDDLFVYHHKTHKGSVFPFWAVIECASFRDLSKLYKNMFPAERTVISKQNYGLNREYVENWLQAISVSRNIAAHSGRFYNRPLKAVRIKLPNKLVGVIRSDQAFAVLFAIYKLQPTRALAIRLIEDLDSLLKKYSRDDKGYLGIPDDWKALLKAQMTRYKFTYHTK